MSDDIYENLVEDIYKVKDRPNGSELILRLKDFLKSFMKILILSK